MQNSGLKDMNNIKCVIFDFDGTLCDLNIDWNHGVLKLEEEILEKYPLYEDEIEQEEIEIRINNRVKKYGLAFKKSIDEFTTKFEDSEIKGYKINKEIIKNFQNKRP